MFQAIQENELVMLIIAIGILVFVVGNFSRLKMFPVLTILIAGFVMFFAGWIFTVLEELHRKEEHHKIRG